jgi:hypothetical protein
MVEHVLSEPYRVAAVVAADGETPAPPEIAERFQGRLFTLSELEARGIRIAGPSAWYVSLGRDWRLTLEPAL